jgi:probable phosphoglycerate mutase
VAESERQYRQTRFTRPAGSTELLLVRHGESEPFVPGRPFPRVGGQGDPALAPEGHRQAELLARRLAGHAIDAIYVTPLRRTAQTAAPLVAHLGIEPRVERDLREVQLGEWEGELYRQRVAEGHPLVVQMMVEQRWDVIPGAESPESLGDRVRGAIERIVADHPDQRVVVFSHGGVIAEILAQVAATNQPFAFLGCDNASISQIVAFSGRWILRRFNDTAHLDSMRADDDLDPQPHLPKS